MVSLRCGGTIWHHLAPFTRRPRRSSGATVAHSGAGLGVNEAEMRPNGATAFRPFSTVVRARRRVTKSWRSLSKLDECANIDCHC